MIPKVFHSVWVQGDLPPEYQAWHASWKKHHPDWEHLLWSEPYYLKYITVNREIYDTAVNHAQRAEIAQKELLWYLGGVWIDADFECFRPIDELLEGVACFTAEESKGQMSAGIVGCTPRHPAMKKLVDDVTPSIERQRARSQSQTYGSGPHMFERNWRSRDDVTIFSPEQFYPYRWDQSPPKDYGDAYAAHHWKATWKSG